MRVGVVTAMTCSLPFWMLPSAGGITLKITGMWLPSTSVVSAAAPLYGTSVTSMPVVALNSSAARCEPLPGGEVPKLSLPGCFFASAIRSATDFAGKSGCETMPMPICAILPIGAKSRRTS